MTTIIYHGDCDDGFGAALAARMHYGDSARYVPGHYGEEPPDVTGEEVFILDFSYPRQMMEDLGHKAQRIVLLDHHKTAVLELADLDLACDAQISFDMNQSGAAMAWQYFHPNKRVPRLIQHIEDNDLWRFKIPGTRYFTRNLRSYLQDFGTWQMLLAMLERDDFYEDFLAEGVAQERFFQAQVDFLLKNTKPQSIILYGHRGLAINATRMFASDAGHRLAELSETFGAVYSIQGDGKVSFSLRSVRDFDVSIIAKHYGGGGHRNAAGFELPSAMHLSALLASKIQEN